MESLQSTALHEKDLIDLYRNNFSGKLLLRIEIPLDEPTFQKLLATGHLTEIKSIQKSLYHHTCIRCGNTLEILFGEIPCKRCDETHIYCRKCIQMGRVSVCETLYYWSGKQTEWTQHEDPCTWDGTLTYAQTEAANKIQIAIETTQQELLIWAVCGAGKTEMLFPGIAAALQAGKRICLATPRADVVKELLPRMKVAFNQVPIEGLYGGSPDQLVSAQFILSTTHQLLRYSEAFDVLIIDEVDAFPFHTDAMLPYAAKRATKQTHTIIYLTATPRIDQQKRIALKKLPHHFVPCRFHGHPLPVPFLHLCFSLTKQLTKGLPPKAFLNWLHQRKNPARQLLIFVPTIVIAEQMTENLSRIFVEIGFLKDHSQITAVHANDLDRADKVLAFRAKCLQVLVTTTILERGVTFPSVDVIVIGADHHVFDEAALVQIAGRAGRSMEDPDGEVIFYHDGKTDAIVGAVQSIRKMNKRGGFV